MKGSPITVALRVILASTEPQKYSRTYVYAALFENLFPKNPLTALGSERTLIGEQYE